MNAGLLTIEDIADHNYWLGDVGDCGQEESAELTERFIDTFGEQDDVQGDKQ